MVISQWGSPYSIRVARGVLATCAGPTSPYSHHVKVEGLAHVVAVFPTANAAAVRLVAVGNDGAFTVSHHRRTALLIEPTLQQVDNLRVHVTASKGRRATLHLSNQAAGVRLAIPLGVLSAEAIRRVNGLCRHGLVSAVSFEGGRLTLNGEIRTATDGHVAVFEAFRIDVQAGAVRMHDPRAQQELALAA